MHAPKEVGSIGLQQAMSMEQADIERRFLRQGSGVAYGRLALRGTVVHDEQARPVRPSICFFWRFCNHEEGLSSRGAEFLHNVAPQPVASIVSSL